MGVDRIWHLFRLLSKDTTKEKKNNKYTSIFILDIPFPFSSNHYIHFEDAKNIQSQTEMRQRKRKRERDTSKSGLNFKGRTSLEDYQNMTDTRRDYL